MGWVFVQAQGARWLSTSSTAKLHIFIQIHITYQVNIHSKIGSCAYAKDKNQIKIKESHAR